MADSREVSRLRYYSGMEKPWLVAIVGPIAVGKMTVGQSLRELTGFELFHNHMVIDLLTPFLKSKEAGGQ